MRSRYVTYRLTAEEYQIIKTKAEKAGASVPVVARRLALETAQIDQIADRLDEIERQLKSVPDRAGMVAALEKLGARIAAVAAKIDSASAAKGGTP
jgi:tetrahydromethanopterin S-methyltransferase subunit G